MKNNDFPIRVIPTPREHVSRCDPSPTAPRIGWRDPSSKPLKRKRPGTPSTRRAAETASQNAKWNFARMTDPSTILENDDRSKAPLRVLAACEYSGAVRDAFRRQGFVAFSCDLLPSEEPGAHYRRDVREVLHLGWDIMVAHPPCTHLSVSGARWFKDKQTEQAEALDFVRLLMAAPIPFIAIENPISVISSKIRKPDQVIQPHQFGHPEFKATCLWLKNLPSLEPTEELDVPDRGSDEWKAWNKVHRASPGPERWKVRSRTYSGIARAMAEQWGDYVRAARTVDAVAA